uniref:Uncharacterized protein n=1 Tax=Anguilla anguilla TaxID=7936 RepID=A0A0E9PH81_ANGAN
MMEETKRFLRTKTQRLAGRPFCEDS